MTWELSYEKTNHKIIIYENRDSHPGSTHLHKFGTIHKNDMGQYYFKKNFFIDGILDTQIEGLVKIINELKQHEG